jgi:protocatechuate 3,4-dioxygenase beta subunit
MVSLRHGKETYRAPGSDRRRRRCHRVRVQRILREPDLPHVDHTYDDGHECSLRGHANGDHRAVSVVDGSLPQRHSRGQGALLALTIKIVDVNNACAGVPNANVEIWHVDASGNYSQYATQTTQTYLRGIQTTNSNGEVVFTTIYPGWSQGRATHIHVEVTLSGRSVKVTQIAFPEAISHAVHATGAYASRGTNPLSNASDGIFADSLSSELITPSGDASSGYAATFQVGITT